MNLMEEKQREVWVVGHRNPDTDSVCAALCYAYLKNQIGDANYVAKKAGPLNEETRFVLEHFGVEEPETISDVGTQIKDLDFRHTEGVSSHISLKKAWELMKSKDVVTLPIVGGGGRLEGLIVNGDIAYSYMDVYDNRILSRARTQYKNIIETLNGTLLTGNEHGYFVKGKVVVPGRNHEALAEEIERDDLVIMGDILERQRIALEQYPSCMIITGVKTVSSEVIAAAEAIDCVLIATEYDNFTAARLINQSMPIKYFMKKNNLTTFELEDTVDFARDMMSRVRHRDFPVLDDKQHYVGMFSRRNLLNQQKKQIILVDHNEKSQAVDGIDEAEILEIIDHHRIGTLETLQPIFFRNQPLGCCSSIVYQMFRENEVEIPPAYAGLMLSAILSDTLMFRSPTCTEFDRQAGEALSRIVGENIETYAMSMFEAGSDFQSKTTEEIFYQDFKIFHFDDVDFGVAQISAVSGKQLRALAEKLEPYLERVLVDKGLQMVFVLLTNILDQGSRVLYKGADSEFVLKRAFPDAEGEEIFLPGVVSRKKQFIPQLMEALQDE